MQVTSGLCQIEEFPRYLYAEKPPKPHVDLLKETERKSYIPIPGCVLTYILSNPEFSHLEKLYYISADSLNLINANSGKQRATALSSQKWATQLGCSRAQVFKLQQSLSDKGFFTIIKDKNNSGQNKRNLIITTLPSKAFDLLVKEPNKAGTHLPYNPELESCRAYLDRTKLFIRLNYQLLKTITVNESLAAFHKVLWLDLFIIYYKYKSVKNKNINTKSDFSLKVSYAELAEKYSCDKRYLSKAMRVLEEAGFIFKEHFYIKGEKLMQDRTDKSLWNITLSIPNEYRDTLLKLNDRSNIKISSKAAESFIATKELPVLKTNDIKQGYLDYKNSEEDFNYQNQTANSFTTDSLARFSVAPLEETLDIMSNKVVENNLKNDPAGASYDPDVVKFRPLLNHNKNFKTNKLQIKNIDNLDSPSTIFIKSASKKSVFLKNCLKELEKKESFTESKTEQLCPKTSDKRLKDLYPLSEALVSQLNHKSGRQFSLNFVNELLLKLDSKYSLRTFSNEKQIINYLIKALSYEKHQEPLVNHESFKFASKDPVQQKKDKVEKYLAAVEANLNTSPVFQLRRKIEALFTPEIAYILLTESKYSRPQPDIFFVELSLNLNLTEQQQERLTNEIQLIYGKQTEVMYGEILSSTFDNNATKTEKQEMARQPGEIYLEELDPNTAWYSVRVALKSRFGEVLDKAWFSKLTAEEDVAQRKMTLKAPTNFIRDWVAQKYSSNIENICKEQGFNFNYRNDLIVETNIFLTQEFDYLGSNVVNSSYC